MLAARGGLALRVPEQLALLMLLVSDPDPAIAARAARTIARLPPDSLATFLANPDVPEHVREFFARRPSAGPDEGPEDDLVTPEADGTENGPTDSGDARAAETEAGTQTSAGQAPTATGEPAERISAVRRLANLSVPARIKAAIQGSREERAILIRDPNRIVAAAVLSSPKLTEGDVETIARMTNVSDDVLRAIGLNRSWTRNYSVVSALTRNAKTPIGVALTLLPRLTERDVKLLSTDRNVPEPVRLSARKMYAHSASRRQ